MNFWILIFKNIYWVFLLIISSDSHFQNLHFLLLHTVLPPKTQHIKKSAQFLSWVLVSTRFHKILTLKRQYDIVYPLLTYCQKLFVDTLLWGSHLGFELIFILLKILESAVLHELFALYSLNKVFLQTSLFLFMFSVSCFIFFFCENIFLTRTNSVGEDENIRFNTKCLGYRQLVSTYLRLARPLFLLLGTRRKRQYTKLKLGGVGSSCGCLTWFEKN